MSEVTQKLGFDATKAIASLRTLSNTIDVLNGSIRTLNSLTSKNPFAASAQAASSANSQMKKLDATVSGLKKNMAGLGTVGKGAAQEITVSWTSMLRYVKTQVLSRGLAELRSEFVETANSARKFELAIARISTISGEGFGAGRDELTSSIRALAVDLGKPIEEVTDAAFDALQNDIADTTQETLEFLKVANLLSVTLGSDLQDSMNALTSVQKAYGQSTAEASDNADIFFVTIDKGRITLDELVDRLGTINPLAAALNIPFQQVGASIAALSQAGLNTATSTTQLRNVLSKLIRPTDELKEAFKTLRVATGQELIASVGGNLPKALQALQGALGGTEDSVANAFGTIRGQLGVLNLLANDAVVVTDILEAFENRAGRAAEAFAKVEETDTRDFDKEMSKISDTMLSLGNLAQAFQLSMAQTFNVLIPDAQAAKAAVIGLGVTGAIAFNGIAISATRATVAMLAATGPIGVIGVALGLLAAEFVANLPDYGEQFRLTIAGLDRSISENTKQFTQSQKDSTAELETSLAEKSALFAGFFADLQTLYQKDTDAFSDTAELVGITVGRLLESFVSSREDLLGRVDSFLAGIDERIKDGTEGVRSALQDLEDFRFDQAQKGLDDTSKAFNELARAQQSAIVAQQAFNQAGINPEALNAASALQKLAESQAKSAAQTASRSTNNQAIDQASRLGEQILQERVRQEQQTVNNLEGIANSSVALQRDRLSQLLADQEFAGKRIADLRSGIDSDGNAKSSAQVLSDTNQIDPLLAEISSIQDRISELRILDDAGVRDLSERTASAFTEGIENANFNFNNAVKTLEATLAQEVFGINIKIANPDSTRQVIRDLISDNQIPGQNLSETILANTNDLKEFITTQNTAANTVELFTKNINDQAFAVSKNAAIILNSAGATPNLTALQGVGAVTEGLFGGSSLKDNLLEKAELVKLVNQLTSEFNRLVVTNTADVRADVVSNVDGIEASLKNITFLDPAQLSGLTTQVNLVRAAIDNFAGLDKNQQLIDTDAAAEAARILGLTSEAAGNFSEQMRRSALSSETTNQQATLVNQSVSSGETALARSAGYWERIAAAAASAQQSSGSISSPGGATSAISQYFGGNMFRNTGGDLTRGQDQTLVAASEGENIINARSSQRFFAELRAINAGQNPTFREQGGPVTNVGDINVNVDARNASSVDGRTIARQLNRELRRTSSNLRG